MDHKEYILQVYNSMKELIDYAETVDSDKVDLVFEEGCSKIFDSNVTVKIAMSILELHPNYKFDYVDPKNDDKSNFICYFYALSRYIKNSDRLESDNAIKNKVESIFSSLI